MRVDLPHMRNKPARFQATALIKQIISVADKTTDATVAVCMAQNQARTLVSVCLRSCGTLCALPIQVCQQRL